MPKPAIPVGRIALIWTLFGALLAASATAQSPAPSPSEFLGFTLGDRFSLHHEVVDFTEALSENPGVSLVEYGKSYEGRPLHALVFTHPDYADRLEDIRAQHIDRIEGGTGDAEFDELAVVWMSYNVHGNEAVCTESALEVMHALALRCAAGDPIMKRLVVFAK